MRSVLLWTFFLCIPCCGLSARILVVLPFPGKSHFIFFSAILKALTQHGHEIVEYSPFPPSKPLPNYTHIEIHSSFEKQIKNMTYKDFKEMSNNDRSKLGFGLKHIWDMSYSICDEVLKHKSVQELLSSKENFDIVMTESSFGQESMLVFGHKFGAPTVTLQGLFTFSIVNRDAGNVLSIASIPDFFSFVTTDQMTFTERLMNFVSTVVTLSAYYYYHLPLHEEIIKENYREDIPPLVDMVSNVSLFLINAHPAMEYPRPYTPNIIPIGGINISPERIPLPQNIQKFMDEATEGVIYFSLGTVVPAHLMPEEVLKIFVNVFNKMPYKVIWKIDLEDISGLPKNVMLTKWVPQPGVLAHPNCVLFLTHGGLFSQQEAIYAGVPTVGIPFFGDQHYNVRFSEHHGFGIKLDLHTLSEETVHSALTGVLSNTKYKKNAQRMSRIFRDRPWSPADSAVFWVEYVLRHNGAHHLRPAATKLSWYQLALLDVLAAILAALLTILIILYLILQKLWSLILGRKGRTHVQSSKKKN